MSNDLIESFAEEAFAIRRRALLDLEDRAARLVDATVRSQRAFSRRFAFRDYLVGLGEGLYDVLRAWGVPERFIFTNDTPVAGYFVERKYWDFAVRDSQGREVVLIEFTRVREVTPAGGRDGLPELCHRLLGMLYDLHFTPRRAFTGLVMVRHDRRAATPPPRAGVRPHPRSGANRLRRLERFDRACRMSGLLDAMAYLDLAPSTSLRAGPGATAEPSPMLSLEHFLATLYRKLGHVPPETWDGKT